MVSAGGIHIPARNVGACVSQDHRRHSEAVHRIQTVAGGGSRQHLDASGTYSPVDYRLADAHPS